MQNVLEWLEADAERTPDAVAVADADSQLTYAELLARSRSAGTFVASRVAPCTPVALYLEKSASALAGMLGCTHAGCCYSVIDVRQPAERVASIARTLAPGLVLADAPNLEAAAERFAATGVEVAALEDALAAPADDALLATRRARALDTDPLYVNFTSGSTGTPKGVAVCHRSVIDFIPRFVGLMAITADDRIANQAPFDFDVSVKDIYGGLAAGAAVHLIPRDYFSVPTRLMDFLADRRLTVCTWAVSAMCFVSVMGGFDYRVPADVRIVGFSGEVMPPKQLAIWRRWLPQARFVNLYGPTEITCNCTWFEVTRDYAKDEVIPCGVPFANEHVFLLGADDHEVTAPGEKGEVCVAGTALALGYYNDPERTAAAFVQNPLNAAWPERIYRTGDVGFWDDEHNLVYAGRVDNQIKHMGQRIELGEIEAAAQGTDGVSRACCAYDARRKRILLFYTGDVEKDALVEALRVRLPQYMVPNRTTHVDQMPLTKNGKIDRAALVAQKGAAR